MGTKAKHMCSIWRMPTPQAAAFLSPALSKWPFRLNCSSQHSPIKNGHQQGKGYLLIHKRYERQYLFCLRFLFTCLGENLNSWNSRQVICVYLICWLWARQVYEWILHQSQTFSPIQRRTLSRYCWTYRSMILKLQWEVGARSKRKTSEGFLCNLKMALVLQKSKFPVKVYSSICTNCGLLLFRFFFLSFYFLRSWLRYIIVMWYKENCRSTLGGGQDKLTRNGRCGSDRVPLVMKIGKHSYEIFSASSKVSTFASVGRRIW